MADVVVANNDDIPLLEEGDQLELPSRPNIEVKTDDVKYEDEYTVMEELGKGKFGVVKKFQRKSDKQLFAGKFIKKTANSRSEVLREIEMLNKLHHKRVICLYDAFELRREMIVVMELVTGGELFEKVVEDDDLTEKQVIRYTKQILFGIQHLHGKDIVHLDLKPENILCMGGDRAGYEEIKLIDFGTARVLTAGDKTTAMCGTPEFVAPEVINYDPVTLAADMWSVGVIVYVLLSGYSPFCGDDDNETLANVTSGDFGNFEEDEDEEDEEESVFKNLSDDVKQFISSLLILQAKKRLTVAESLSHDWMKSEGNEKKLNVGKLKKFLTRRRWQKTANAIKAVGRLTAGLMSVSSLNKSTQGGEGQTSGSFLDNLKQQIQNEENDDVCQE